MKKTKKKTIVDQLYIHTSQEIPLKLLNVMIQCISEYDEQFCNGEGRQGLLGVTEDIANQHLCEHDDMLRYQKCLTVGTSDFRDILKDIRVQFPFMRMDEWYLFTLAAFQFGRRNIIPLMKKLTTNTWLEYRHKFSLGVGFANMVWGKFLEDGGSVT